VSAASCLRVSEMLSAGFVEGFGKGGEIRG
jgi:hypothetical protein